MPLSLSDFKRPPEDNGRGIHGSAVAGWTGGDQGLDYWIEELQALGIKWFKVLDEQGNSFDLCQKLIAAGIFPVVRLIRHDPPPNDSPEPNPGHLDVKDEQRIRKLVDAGVVYFETNNEPNLTTEWKNNAIPENREEAGKLVALNWLFDARMILDAGGYPALPAVSVGSDMDLMAALVSLGMQSILLDGCWIAIHNYCLNHPLDYPEDSTNQMGVPVAPGDYEQGPLTKWVWWDMTQGRQQSLDEVNQIRAARKNRGATILQDRSCFREYEYYFSLAQKYLGRPIPVLSTEGGFLVGQRQDPRYLRVTPQMHADQTVALYDFMQHDAPDYYFACMPWLLLPSAGRQQDAWYSDFWHRIFEEGPRGREPLPPFPVPGAYVGPELPVVHAVKSMKSVARPLVTKKPQESVSIDASSVLPGKTSYIVQKGDTLTSIARKYNTSITAIVMENHISDPSQLAAGQTLIIPTGPGTPPPPPTKRSATPPPPAPSEMNHVLQQGETLASVASRYDTTISAIVAANSLADPNRVAAGQRLIIPVPVSASAAQEPPPPAVPPAAAPLRPPVPPPTPPRPTGVAQFDPRLTALGVRVSNAMAVPGVLYWKLVSAVYMDAAESVGLSAIYISLIDEKGAPVDGQRVLQASAEHQLALVTDGSGNARHTMEESFLPEQGEVGPYSVWVDGLPSDRVTGLGRPHNQPVSFRLTWQKTKK